MQNYFERVDVDGAKKWRCEIDKCQVIVGNVNYLKDGRFACLKTSIGMRHMWDSHPVLFMEVIFFFHSRLLLSYLSSSVSLFLLSFILHPFPLFYS